MVYIWWSFKTVLAQSSNCSSSKNSQSGLINNKAGRKFLPAFLFWSQLIPGQKRFSIGGESSGKAKTPGLLLQNRGKNKLKTKCMISLRCWGTVQCVTWKAGVFPILTTKTKLISHFILSPLTKHWPFVFWCKEIKSFYSRDKKTYIQYINIRKINIYKRHTTLFKIKIFRKIHNRNFIPFWI